MAKYDVFISYSRRDGADIAHRLSKALEERGIAVWLDVDALDALGFWAEQIVEAISACHFFIPIITESYNSSQSAQNELSFAYQQSVDRSKTIIPIAAAEIKSDVLRYYLGRIRMLRLEGPEDLSALADKIGNLILNQTESERLYEKISEYSKLGNSNKEAEAICQLTDRLCNQFQTASDNRKRRETCKEILRLYQRLAKYSGRYDEESKHTVRRVLKTLDHTSMSLYGSSDPVFLNDLFFCAFAVQMIYLDREIRSECADVITSGDARNPCPLEQYIEKQKPYAEAFRSLYSLHSADTTGLPDEESAIIADTTNFICDSAEKQDEVYQPAKSREQASVLSDDDEILLSIAHFMQEGNKLFDVLQKERMEGSFLKCLLTSYERLKAYCQVVGASDVAAQCVDRILEIRNLVEKSGDTASEDGKAEKGIKSLLGFTLHGSGSYDVFISFKNEDSDLAETIYTYCKKHFKEPFWSKRSLPELSASEYEDAIYDALRKSKHFIVVLSKVEYMKEKWVKKEMATFDRAITEGRKTDSNFLFVVTDEVYRQIIGSNKMCLDERYCGYQIIKMSEYDSVLYKYL